MTKGYRLRTVQLARRTRSKRWEILTNPQKKGSIQVLSGEINALVQAGLVRVCKLEEPTTDSNFDPLVRWSYVIHRASGHRSVYLTPADEKQGEPC